MKKGIAVLVVLFAALYFARGIVLTPNVANVIKDTETESVQPVALPDVAVPKEKKPKKSHLTLPKVSTTRKEVESDPETPPFTLLEFADTLTPRLEAALKDETEADQFFSELSDCVLAPAEVMETAKALCLKNATRLAQHYPQRLGGELDRLRQRTSQRILWLTE